MESREPESYVYLLFTFIFLLPLFNQFFFFFIVEFPKSCSVWSIFHIWLWWRFANTLWRYFPLQFWCSTENTWTDKQMENDCSTTTRLFLRVHGTEGSKYHRGHKSTKRKRCSGLRRWRLICHNLRRRWEGSEHRGHAHLKRKPPFYLYLQNSVIPWNDNKR